ncbi:MAG: hypothetical protein ACLQVY_05355 [Limisphaerales bacterium]
MAQQPADTNASASQVVQPAQTVQSILLPETNTYAGVPELTNELSTETGLTNPPIATTTPPPVLGPRYGGGDQLAPPLMGTGVFGVPGGAAAAAGIPTGTPLAHWGPFDVHASLSHSLTYGNGIESQPGSQEKTLVNTVSPGLILGLGKMWTLSYNPAYTVYSSADLRNTLSQSAFLSGHFTYEDWTFSLSQSYAYSDEPLIETGTQTSQEDYSTALGAGYQINSTLSLQMSANQDLRFTPQFDNLKQWGGSIFLNDIVFPRLVAGLGFSGGYDDQSTGSSIIFESLQARITFNPSAKLSLALSGGAEDTQFVNPSAPSLLNPTFAASLIYRPLPNTSVTLTASRTVTPSFYGNEIEVVTGVNGAIRQQLSKKFALSLSAGYTTEPLTSIEPAPLPQFFLGPPPVRALTVVEKNDYTTVGATLSYAVIARGIISVFYMSSDNSSGQANFKYSSSQLGVSASYRY